MTPKLLALAGIAALSVSHAPAALVQWQSEVASGTAAAKTNFSAVTAPVLFDIGSLSGDRSLEFIVRADTSAFGLSAALIGTFNTTNGRQGLKAKQWEGDPNPNSHLGLTQFGVLDHVSTVSMPSNVDVHLVFTSNGTDSTQMYLNGALAATFSAPLALTGIQGLGGVATAENTLATVVDPLTGGSINGFASYDAALSGDEIAAHYRAFAAPVPEPGALALAALAGLAGMARRSRRSA